MVPAVYRSLFACVASKMFSKVERDYWRFRGIIGHNSSRPADASADVRDELVDIFVQNEL